MGRKPKPRIYPQSAAAPESVEPSVTEKTEADPGYQINGRDGTEARLLSSLSLKIGPDGAVDSSTTDKTWRKLSEAIEKTSGARERLLGKSGGSVLIESRQIEPFYTGIGLLNTFLAIRLLKIDSQLAGSIVPYNKDEVETLSQATADAVNENLDKCPKWLLDLLRGGGSIALAKLAMVLFQVHAQKFQLIKQTIEQQSKQPPVVQ